MTTMGQCALTYQKKYRYILPGFWTRIRSTVRCWTFGHRRDTSNPLSNAIRRPGDHHVDLPVITQIVENRSYLA